MAVGRAPRVAEDAIVHEILPARGWVRFDFGELWRYRELLYFLTWRNVIIRYKQTALGIAWAILQPVFLMIVFSIFLGKLADVPSDGIPYPIFAYAALVPWTFFSTSLTQASNSLVGSANLIGKIYFPRIAIPIATVLSALVDFVLAFTVLVGLMVYYGLYPDPVALVALPAFVALAFMTALGASLWLSALNVMYRDVQYVVPFLAQLWLFATPVVYPASLAGEPWRTLLGLNPMSGVVEGFRWSLVGAGDGPGPMVLLSALVAVVLLVSGAAYFRRMEQSFADVI